MSKKFGTNTKSAEARARKDAVKQSNEREKQQRLEDEYWHEDDKLVQKKLQRKDERENKEHEKLQRKQEIQKLLEQEEAALTASKAKKPVDSAPKKVTQAQIQQQQTTGGAAAAPTGTNVKQKPINDEETPIEENINRLQIDGSTARNINEALHVLSSSQILLDSHPEKRMKAAFDAYEKENLPKLKQEHPTLRMSQLKQLLKKEWMKSPDNPFNKPTKAYNQGSVLPQNVPANVEDSDHDED
ncbi:unnamed protein product [Rotaria socialis]|uniref:Coiled-coil domain-containing protein n=1 Tax=Rotaria socialis TaxID=392032 RepID=A0A821N2L4_9BILA|nr:unnamed protein product [Rotaria socialis]CAF3464746.1 unnamed protein product [Rotaria socialis]CAF4606651.1 unnamed protein product [Rotaria socialis]CAF4778815.1 unnamed protein product [Rotaria socialis]